MAYTDRTGCYNLCFFIQPIVQCFFSAGDMGNGMEYGFSCIALLVVHQ